MQFSLTQFISVEEGKKCMFAHRLTSTGENEREMIVCHSVLESKV